jgi:glycosyltransferase involved in cell wall biosynthesis
MKVCLISHADSQAGAGIAAYRLHEGLKKNNITSTMLVANKTTDDFTVLGANSKLDKAWGKIAPTLDSLPLKAYSEREQQSFSLQWIPDKINYQITQINPEIINLHWINCGYLNIENITKFKQPIIWTLHDMWAFTGGCHYNGDCQNYINSCGNCPQLNSNKENDLSRWVWKRKQRAWQNLNLTVITPSHWLAKCAASSSLFKDTKIEIIPNGIDINKYKSIDKSIARSILGLPQDKQLILFGAISATSDTRKGFHLLESALKQLSQAGWENRIELVIFGASQPQDLPKIGFKSHYLGRLNDDISLSLVYSAADIFIAPSLQDNLPNTIIESLSCSTPCVAFNIGGIPDIIDHQQNGYLAQPYEIEDLTKGIIWILENKQRWRNLCNNARQTVEQKFTLEIQAKSYLSIYQELINNYTKN